MEKRTTVVHIKGVEGTYSFMCKIDKKQASIKPMVFIKNKGDLSYPVNSTKLDDNEFIFGNKSTHYQVMLARWDASKDANKEINRTKKEKRAGDVSVYNQYLAHFVWNIFLFSQASLNSEISDYLISCLRDYQDKKNTIEASNVSVESPSGVGKPKRKRTSKKKSDEVE